MADEITLNADDRGFFELVGRAAFANPFGEARLAADRRIADLAGIRRRADQVEVVAGQVRAKIEDLQRRGRADIRRYRADDRQRLAIAILFDAIHRWMEDFDRLLEEQLAAGDVSAPIPFAPEVLAFLKRHGFSEAEAERYFAMFYQLRRAFYLIDRGLVGASASMGRLRERLWNNVFTSDIQLYDAHLWDRMEDFSTVLLGETGTGKGAVAAALGRSGFIPFQARGGRFAQSFQGIFFALNLSQFPPNLIESELFGHTKGAFTGAVAEHDGALARCSPHGAVFLDEIGDVSVPVQIKLLQVLQERTFTPVGSHARRRFRGRVIAATNHPLDDLRRDGRFRDDFYYRLCSDVLELPSLRRRLAEHPPELEILLGQIVARLVGHPAAELAEQIAAALRAAPGTAYAWPGNVRELEQAARRVLLTGRYEGQATVPGRNARACFMAAVEAGALDADELLAGYCAERYAATGSYEEVARRLRLDRRTVRRYVLLHGRLSKPASAQSGGCR